MSLIEQTSSDEERARTDAFEVALGAVVSRLDFFSLLAAVDELRARPMTTTVEVEAMDYVVQIIDTAASRIVLGPLFAPFRDR